jgi:hypothetical protein
MAGNKALEKIKDSKIPKKGVGVVNDEVPIYQEPNTHSKIIGTIKKDELINWISKSICDGKEWVRCNGKNNFGYIVGNENDGKCNLNMDSVQEVKDDYIEIKKYNYKFEVISKEEDEYGDEAVKKILEEVDEKDENNNVDISSVSTELSNIINQNENLYKGDNDLNKFIDDEKNEEIKKEDYFDFEQLNEDIFKEENLDNLYFDGDITLIPGANKEIDKLYKNIINTMEQDKSKKIIISETIESIYDLIPGQQNSQNIDLESILDSIPGGNKNNLMYYKEKKEDTKKFKLPEIDTMSVISFIAEVMKKMKKEIVIRDKKNKKIIKKFKISKIGEKLDKLISKIGNILSAFNLGKAFVKDGFKFGDNFIVTFFKEGSSFVGSMIVAFFGLFFSPVVTVAAEIIISAYFSEWGEKLGKYIVNENKKN